MENLSEYHQDLLIGKLAGTLTEEETAELNALLHDNTQVRLAFENIQHEFPAGFSHNNFEKPDQPGYWRDLTNEIQNKIIRNKRVVLMRKLVTAAVITGLALTGWFLFETQFTKKSTSKAGESNSPSVQLKLADGNVINLSTEKGDITRKGTKLINKNNSLQYSVTGNEGDGINSVTVPTGMDYRIVLGDGSIVWMNSLTQLDFPFKFSKAVREITLSGEAYLEIAKDASKPFIVHLPNSTVSVLGTKFNVNTYDTGTVTVALMEGKVNITGGNQSVPLMPGKLAIYNYNTDAQISTQEFNPKKILSWRNGLFYFDDAGLNEIGRVLNRWYGVHVKIDNSSLNQKRFAGILDRNKPLQVFLDDLKGMSRISSSIDKDGILHFK